MLLSALRSAGGAPVNKLTVNLLKREKTKKQAKRYASLLTGVV